jgi:Colicin E5 ribonuclease domain
MATDSRTTAGVDIPPPPPPSPPPAESKNQARADLQSSRVPPGDQGELQSQEPQQLEPIPTSQEGDRRPEDRRIDEAKTHYEDKIVKVLENRGWTQESIEHTIGNPSNTIEARDIRWRPDGTRNDDPATTYFNEDGSYVVRNDRTGDIIQVSKRTDDWESPY